MEMPDTGEETCDDGQQNFAGVCAVPVECNGGTVSSPENMCVCPPDRELVGGVNCYVECPDGRERVGQTEDCACPEGQQEVNDVCVPATGEAACTESGGTWRNGRCLEACEGGQVRIGQSEECVCPEGQQDFAGICAVPADSECAASGQVPAEGGGCRRPNDIGECIDAGVGEVIENGVCAASCLGSRSPDPASRVCRGSAGSGVSGGNLPLPPPPPPVDSGYDPLEIPLLPAPIPAGTVNYRTREFGMQPSLAQVNADAAYQRGYFGQSVIVAVVDSGVAMHPEFEGRLLAGFNAVNRSSETGDIDGHGTFVAGVVGAARDGEGMHGIAPEASILPLKLADDSNEGGLPGEPALAFSEGGRSGALVFNNSYAIGDVRAVLLTNLPPGHRLEIAAGRTLYAELPLMAEGWTLSMSAVNRASTLASVAMQTGGIYVWAAGNEGWREEGGFFAACDLDDSEDDFRCEESGRLYAMSPREFLQYAYDVEKESMLSAEGLNVNSAGFYAEIPLLHADLQGQWLAVGASNSSSDVAAGFSNGCGLSKYWCLFAPGAGIYSTRVRDPDDIREPYVFAQGTSFSAPFVSGGLALLKSRLPGMPMEAVRAILLYTAEDLGEPGIDDVYGWGRMDIGRAITLQTSLTVRVSQSLPSAEERGVLIDLPPPAAPNVTQNFRTPEFERQYGLSRIGADAAYWRGYFGQGATVAYIGYGMLTAHAELIENAAPGFDLVAVTSAVSDDLAWPRNPYGGGTFDGAVIAAAMDGAGMHGVAPSASIMPFRISDRFGQLDGDSGFAFIGALSSGAHVVNTGFRYITNAFGEYRGTLHHALLPSALFFNEENRGLTPIAIAAGVAELEGQTTPVVVVPAGDGGWNSETGQIRLCSDFDSVARFLECPGGYVHVSPEEFITDFEFKEFQIATTVSLYALDRSGSTVAVTVVDRRLRTSSLWEEATFSELASLLVVRPNLPGDQAFAPLFDENLQDNWLVAVATDQNDVIAPFSNGCGDAKFWCLAAPGASIYSASALGDRGYTVASRGSAAAAHVSGALALLKSRLPDMPMEALRAILLYTAEDLGEAGVDDVYGWGLVNIERAITLQGRFTVAAGEQGLLLTAESGDASARGVNLQDARIQLPSALSHVEAGLAGVSVAVGGIGNAHYNAPLSDFVEVRDAAAQVAYADAAADMLTTDERRFQAGNLFAAADAKSGQLQYAGALVDAGPLGAWSFRGDFCDDCIASVWPEWQAADAAKQAARQAAFQGYDAMEPALGGFEIMPSSLPFFARESGEASFMASMQGEGLRPFAAAGEGDAPYRQYGLRWRKSLVGGLGLVAEASEVRESETFWGADFGSLGRASAQTRQARLFAGGDLNEEWRGFGGYEASFGSAEAEGGALLQGVSGMRSSEWSAGLERRDVFSWGDALRARVSWRRVSGGEAVISHAVADEEECDFTCAFYGSLEDTPEYLVAGEQELESRESSVSLSSSASWSAALGYAFRSSRKSRVSLGASHASEGMTTFSAAIRAEF